MNPLPGRLLGQLALTMAIAALTVTAFGVDGVVRTTLVTAFLLAGPGLAAVHVMGLPSAVAQGAVAVGSSVAALALVSEAFLYLGISGAVWVVTALAAATILCTGPPLVVGRGVEP